MADCARTVAQRVQRQYDSVRDFSADFEQTSSSAVFGSTADGTAARGQVVLAKPGRMRWTYVLPEPSLVVSDGATLWLYSPDLREAQRLPMTEGYLTGAAIQFLLGEGKLLESFDVTAPACSENAGTVELILSPREEATYLRLGLRASPSTGAIESTSVVDLFGNETRIAFSNIRLDQAPPLSTFQFEPPPDVEVIDLRGAP